MLSKSRHVRPNCIDPRLPKKKSVFRSQWNKSSHPAQVGSGTQHDLALYIRAILESGPEVIVRVKGGGVMGGVEGQHAVVAHTGTHIKGNDVQGTHVVDQEPVGRSTF